jgi:hypothetical protein
MSTRSYIGRLNQDDGTVDYVYCHHDGYPSGVGSILVKHYSRPEDVASLLELGDMSALNTDTETSVFYGRDRHESETEAKQVRNQDEFGSLDEFKYLYDEYSEQWTCYDANNNLTMIPSDNEDMYS